MNVWDKISNATKRVPGPPGGGFGGAAAAVSGRWHRAKPWVFVALAGYVVWAIGSGTAKTAATTFVVQLLALLPTSTIALALLAVLGILIGFALLKAPKGHALAEYGKRLLWVAPVALVAAAALIPTVGVVLAMTTAGVTELEKSYLGQKPAANLCTAAGLTDSPPAPVAAPTPHR